MLLFSLILLLKKEKFANQTVVTCDIFLMLPEYAVVRENDRKSKSQISALVFCQVLLCGINHV